jgi:hypothetical protein
VVQSQALGEDRRKGFVSMHINLHGERWVPYSALMAVLKIRATMELVYQWLVPLCWVNVYVHLRSSCKNGSVVP